MWGIDPGGKFYRYSGDDAYPANPWVLIGGAGIDIGAAADGTVWHVNSGNEIYRHAGDLPG